MPPPNDGTKRLSACSLALKPMVTLSGVLIRQGLPRVAARRLRNNNSLADSGNNYQWSSLFVQLATLVFRHSLNSVLSHLKQLKEKSNLVGKNYTQPTRKLSLTRVHLCSELSSSMRQILSRFKFHLHEGVCVSLTQSLLNLALRLS